MTNSKKTKIISAFCALTEMDKFDLNANSVLLVTSIGLISGKLLDINDLSEPDFSVINSTNKTVDDYFSNSDNQLLVEDDYISLRDVKIISTAGNSINLKHLNVFDDQIIGITIGNYPVDAQY